MQLLPLRAARFPALGALVVCLSANSVVPASGDMERGRRLFNGEESMAAKLAGHSAPSSGALGACAHCHGAGQGATLEPRAAPTLSCTALREARPRRGGPSVAYDRDSFCRTLRTRIDPNYVVLGRAMPRFEPDQGQCEALWAYLTMDGSGANRGIGEN